MTTTPEDHSMEASHQDRPLVYFDRNGGDYPWFLREADGVESTYATLGLAVAEGTKVAGTVVDIQMPGAATD